MKTVLPSSIETIEQAKAYLTDLYNNGESYHPEDGAENVSWNLHANDIPTETECIFMDKLMNDIYRIAKGTDFDPCEFLLELDPDYKRD